MTDAWQQLDELLERFTLTHEVRPDLTVHGHATKRGVELVLSKTDYSLDADDMHRVREYSSGPRNVRTMRELAHALLDACAFVEKSNPEWAAR